jgi:predicted nucleotidyltransferase component of viral defense system
VISRSELAAWAERFGVARAQIERDHFISHTLHALGSHDPTTQFFGGTALCRTYLEGTRLSEDIDLLHPVPRDFLDDLAAQLPTALRREFPGTSCTSRESEGDGYVAFLAPPDLTPIKLYVGQLGPNARAWEFAPTSVQLRYRDLPEVQILQCPTLATFAAMKLAAWFDRHAPRDLFDLAGLAALGILGDPEVDRMFHRKMGIELVASEFQRVPKVTADAWQTELAAQMGALPAADACLREVRIALGRE